MGSMDPSKLQNALQKIFAATVLDPQLIVEHQRARLEFFGARVLAAVTETAEQRFREWFVLERESERLGVPPVEASLLSDDSATMLADSLVSVFTVTESFGDTADLIDLQDDEFYEVRVPADALQKGDLVVGRIHPDPAGGWQPSVALAVYRPGAVLAAAFKRDRATNDLDHQDHRLSQIEIEHLLLARKPFSTQIAKQPIEHLEAKLEGLLKGVDSSLSPTEISAALADAIRAGSVIGPLLDEFAFDTDVDLENLRILLLELWSAHHAGDLIRPPDSANPKPTAKPPVATAKDDIRKDESLGESLVRALDRGLAEKRDVEELFAQIEAMAGIEPEVEDEDAEDDPIDDLKKRAMLEGTDRGDLSPFVQEFLWETAPKDPEVTRVLQILVDLQQNATVPHIDVESVTSQDLLRLLLHCYLAAEPAARAATVRTAFGILREFYAWVEVTQEMSLRSVLLECQGSLLDHLDRLQAAGLSLSTSLDAMSSKGTGLLRVEDVAVNGLGLLDDDGGNHWVPTPAATAALLREGDLLLGALTTSSRGIALSGLVVALPALAEALIG